MNKKLFVSFLRYFLAIVFIVSAITKLIEPGLFEMSIINQGIISTRELASYFARAILIVELFLGIALLQTYYLKGFVLPISILSLIGFTLILLGDVFIGKTDNCGCFGEVLKMSPLAAISKNIFLLAIGIFAFQHSQNKFKKLYVPISILIVSTIIVLSFAPIKSYDDLIFSKYTKFSNSELVDLTTNDKLVAIFYIDCEHCNEVAKSIVELENKTEQIKNLYILFAGEGTDSVKTFLTETKINHPYMRISIDDFFELIGNSPPRFYWLENGKVHKFWDDNFIKNIKQFVKYSK